MQQVVSEPEPVVETAEGELPAEAETVASSTAASQLEEEWSALTVTDVVAPSHTQIDVVEETECARCDRLQSSETQLMRRVQELETQLDTAKAQLDVFLKPGFEKQLLTDESVHFHTGLPCRETFESMFRFLEPSLSLLHGKTSKSSGRRRQLAPKEEFLLVLMRLKLASPMEDLRYRFKLRDSSRVSKILGCWIPFLAAVFKPLLLWPSRRMVLKKMPAAFKANPLYCQTRVILDCAEFEMEGPSSLSLNSMTYSDYKGRNTVKVLFGVTPDGYISFVSDAYPGCISDNAITVKSGILDKLSLGDDIMADKGFTLSNSELQPKGLKLVVPPFRCGSGQFSAEEVEATKVIANLRIVVENCILRTRYYRILPNRIPVASVKSVSDIVRVCAVLANLRPPIR